MGAGTTKAVWIVVSIFLIFIVNNYACL
jgi:hypothetical protein